MPKDNYEALEALRISIGNDTWFKAVDSLIRYEINMGQVLEARTLTKTTLIRMALDA